MNQADGTLEMFIGGDILVVRTGGAIVRKTQPMPIAEMLIQQSLVSAVEANPSLRQGYQSRVVLEIGAENHHPAIEAIGPADVRDGGEMCI